MSKKREKQNNEQVTIKEQEGTKTKQREREGDNIVSL